MDASEIVSIILVAIVLAFFIVYHAFFLRMSVKRPYSTVLGLTRQTRHLWVTGIMRTGDQILAVQSLRNQLLSSSLTSAVSVAITFGVTTFVSGLSKLNDNADTYLGLPATVRGYKVVMLIVIQMLAFFCFMQCNRYLNHVIFLVNVRWDEATLQEMDGKSLVIVRQVTPGLVGRVLNTGNLFFTIGVRLLYLSVPVVMWLFGHWFMFGTGILLPPILYIMDFGSARRLAYRAKKRSIPLQESEKWMLSSATTSASKDTSAHEMRQISALDFRQRNPITKTSPDVNGEQSTPNNVP
ncbi:DUF599-domain-containing protein [Gonapodya prolifera JEL478]|uniref:DUF599-domain-containing protein n=1 Tax=Gonapodya prolifera (strain JEL478) TaxID=1344416 RepID=A0A139AGE7_GONPJ|nr:DUF599-domain-containing protein [Gonapodya prolifera JEL478]|eukprot:KXS15515.1 DUF599-domain-containing protein [Gonapodya prolifera JEL478]